MELQSFYKSIITSLIHYLDGAKRQKQMSTTFYLKQILGELQGSSTHISFEADMTDGDAELYNNLVLFLVLYVLYWQIVAVVKSVKMSRHRQCDITKVLVRCKIAGTKGTNKNIINKRLTLDRISFESFHFLKKYHWI